MSGICVSDMMDLVIKTSLLIYLYFLDNYKIKTFIDYSLSNESFFHHTEEQLLYIHFNAPILHRLHSALITNSYSKLSVFDYFQNRYTRWSEKNKQNLCKDFFIEMPLILPRVIDKN